MAKVQNSRVVTRVRYAIVASMLAVVPGLTFASARVAALDTATQTVNAAPTASERLFDDIAAAQAGYMHDYVHSDLWQVGHEVAKSGDMAQVLALTGPLRAYETSVGAAYAQFVAEVQTATTSAVTSQAWNDAYDAAQATYIAALSAAEATLVTSLQSQGFAVPNLLTQLTQAHTKLSNKLDIAQKQYRV